jgi:enoyl-CoA hydratase/carnithine racemase
MSPSGDLIKLRLTRSTATKDLPSEKGRVYDMTTTAFSSHQTVQPLPMEFLPGNAALITLENPEQPLVILDRSLLARLEKTLDEIPSSCAALLIRSSDEKVFVAGANLKEIDSLGDDQLRHYLAEGTRIFRRISDLPCPSVALINGAALGGGLELALHCTGIVATRSNAKGRSYPIGLPEAGLGLCPGWGGTQRLPGRVDARTAIEAAALGQPFTSEDSPEGLVDVFVDSVDELIPIARSWIESNQDDIPVRTVQQLDSEATLAVVSGIRDAVGDNAAAMAVCEAVHAGVEQGLDAGLAAERRLLVALRGTDETRKKLNAFFEGQR